MRDLIDLVDIGSGTDRDQPEIILTGALAMLKLTMPETTTLAASGHDSFETSVKVVADFTISSAAASGMQRRWKQLCSLKPISRLAARMHS